MTFRERRDGADASEEPVCFAGWLSNIRPAPSEGPNSSCARETRGEPGSRRGARLLLARSVRGSVVGHDLIEVQPAPAAGPVDSGHDESEVFRAGGVEGRVAVGDVGEVQARAVEVLRGSDV